MSRYSNKTPEELLLEYRAIQKLEHQLVEDNKIEYFGTVDEELWKAHKDCCKLGKGPNPPQQKLLDAWRDLKYIVFTFTGSNKLGKTQIGTIIGVSFMLGYFPWEKKKDRQKISKPPVKIRYIGQDWENHIKTVVIPALKKWWPKNRKVKTSKNNQGVEAFWECLGNGSTLEVMSNKQESDVFEGWDGDLVIYDEPPKRDIRIACARGLAVSNGRELFTATLLKEAWLDRDVIKARLEDGTPDPSVFNVHGVITDNLGFGLTQEGINNFAKKLTPEEKQARIHGVPSYMSGIVYPQFDRDKHLKEPFTVPLEWIVDIAIDYHPSKPWAVLFMATNELNFKYIVDEMWRHGSWKDIGEEIVRRCKYNQYRVENIVIDPLAKGDPNSDLKEESVYQKMSDLFAAYSYNLFGASKDKEGGIQMTKDILITQNKEAALLFFNNLKQTIYEIEGYMYDEHGKAIEKDDDMMECLRRLVLIDTQWYSRKKSHRTSLPPNWKVA